MREARSGGDLEPLQSSPVFIPSVVGAMGDF